MKKNDMKLKFVVKKDEDEIKRILIDELKISKEQIKKIKDENILVNNKIQKMYQKVYKNDQIIINLDYCEDNSNIMPNPHIKFQILYEDDWLIIVNKPKSIPVHPTMRHYEDSLSNGIRYYYDKINLHKKIRPVNRLDKDTTGIVMFAKSEYIQSNLTKYQKEYIAIVDGILEGKGTINKRIARKENSIIERCVSESGQEAVTHFEVLKNYKDYTLVKCMLETGKTHQIRVHFASIGHPILGDTLYGKKSTQIDRQALHAYKITFMHPVSKEKITITAELPEDMKKLL